MLLHFGLIASLVLRAPAQDTAYFAGGCFWGVEAVFEHLSGVGSVVSVYADTPDVTVEAVRVVYDSGRISYRQLLEVFFTLAHDPTLRDRQGPDQGTEYRAVAFYRDGAQRSAIVSYLAELVRSHRFARPIVTEVQPFTVSRVAEPFHQDYLAHHLGDPYIVYNDLPKLEHLRRDFPALYRESPAQP